MSGPVRAMRSGRVLARHTLAVLPPPPPLLRFAKQSDGGEAAGVRAVMGPVPRHPPRLYQTMQEGQFRVGLTVPHLTNFQNPPGVA